MKFTIFIGLAIMFALCNAMPKGSTPKQAESSKGEQWRSLLDNPLENMNKAMGLSHAVKDVISNLKDMSHLPWKNPLTHSGLKNKKNIKN